MTFPSPRDETLYVKRVIGISGDHIEIRKGVVWRNGKPLTEPYVTHPMNANEQYRYGAVDVPPK